MPRAPLCQALDKMPQVAAMMEDPAFRLEFPDPEPLDPPVLQIREIAFGYTPDRTLFRDAAIGVDLESRIGRAWQLSPSRRLAARYCLWRSH